MHPRLAGKIAIITGVDTGIRAAIVALALRAYYPYGEASYVNAFAIFVAVASLACGTLRERASAWSTKSIPPKGIAHKFAKEGAKVLVNGLPDDPIQAVV